MTGPKQGHRAIAVSSPLGPDALVLRRLHASEGLSRPFEAHLELLTTRRTVDVNRVLGENMTVRLTHDGGTRYLNGYVTSLQHVMSEGSYGSWHASLRPSLWFLTLNRDSRIFQDKTVPDIVKAVLGDHGITNIESRLSGDYKTWEYCVQYQESDFDFVSRLLEHEGIYYYFVHANGSHKMVLADGIGAHDPLEPSSRIRFTRDLQEGIHDDAIWDWSVDYRVQGGAVMIDDFDFTRPKATLRTSLEMARPHALSRMEVFEYPGNIVYSKRNSGDAYARVRMEEIHGRFERTGGSTSVEAMSPGRLFTLTNHPRTDQNREYLVLETALSLVSDAFEANDAAGGEHFACTFNALPSKEPFRPARVTPWPRMQGPQTAIVTGNPGEEIWTDEYGRVKVRFHWDRRDRADATSSCWIRVSQGWAGKRWGAMFLPRVGQEVIVDFLDGDPNRPIVTGRVYNADAMPPYDLPARSTVSTIRTSSSKGAAGGNEIRFEDKAGAQQLFFFAERNQDNRVKKDSLEHVGGERHLIVVKSQYEKVEGDKHSIVTGDRNEKVDGGLSLTIGADVHASVATSTAVKTGTELHLKAGTTIVVEAGSQLTLKVGGSFVVIDSSGVIISGPLVKINSGGSAGSGAGANPDAPVPPKEADTTEAGKATQVARRKAKVARPQVLSSHPVAEQLRAAHRSGTPFCAQCEVARQAQADRTA
jgi:type VI secretion system secreted protein VgrG